MPHGVIRKSHTQKSLWEHPAQLRLYGEIEEDFLAGFCLRKNIERKGGRFIHPFVLVGALGEVRRLLSSGARLNSGRGGAAVDQFELWYVGPNCDLVLRD